MFQNSGSHGRPTLRTTQTNRALLLKIPVEINRRSGEGNKEDLFGGGLIFKEPRNGKSWGGNWVCREKP